jgi:hypothetical protein
MSIETKQIDGYKIRIEQDSDPCNPRTEWDNLGTMVCFHRQYTLGDLKSPKNKQNGGKYHGMDMEEAQEFEAVARADAKNYVVLSLFLYDHSGITISTNPFSCPWDSGKVGFIFVSKKTLVEEKIMTADESLTNIKLRMKIVKYLEGEVETYDKYLRGDVCGYVVESPDGDEVDSCWGYFGEKDAMGDAEAVVKNHLADDKKTLAMMAY